MDLQLEPEIYSPKINDNNIYVDYIPSNSILQNGIRCPCGTRTNHIYNNHSKFGSHIKTKTHIKWLDNLNLNTTNYYIENIKLNETINNQKLIIGKMEKDIFQKDILIELLNSKLKENENNKKNETFNLLEFD